MRKQLVCGPLNDRKGDDGHARKSETNEQIIYALQPVEAGKKVADVWLETGVSEATFYAWKGALWRIGRD